MTEEKLYPGAPTCAPEINLADSDFWSPGAAVPGLSAQPLGTYTESSDPPPAVLDRRRSNRAQRYELLATARDLLRSLGRALDLEHPSDYHRTAKCSHTPISDVAVLRSKDHGSAFYKGLAICGNVWACPVCAAKVQERRRAEIAAGFDWAYSQGLQPLMVTLTFPHRAWNDLCDLVLQQREALKLFRAGAPWKRLVASTGYQGLIRGLEIMHGRNGWHPHTHEIWFCSSAVEAAALQISITKQWASACMRAGLLKADQLEAFEAHAVDVKGWCSTSDYLAKADDSKHWGADREMSKASTKAGKLKGVHPFGLLAAAAGGDRRSAKLFLEFVMTMRATRSRQLFWSPGLKARAGLKEKSDESLAEEQADEADLLGQLEVGDWQRVRHYRKRAQLLDAAEVGGWPAVILLLGSLRRLARSGQAPAATRSAFAVPGPS